MCFIYSSGYKFSITMGQSIQHVRTGDFLESTEHGLYVVTECMSFTTGGHGGLCINLTTGEKRMFISSADDDMYCIGQKTVARVPYEMCSDGMCKIRTYVQRVINTTDVTTHSNRRRIVMFDRLNRINNYDAYMKEFALLHL